MSEKKKHAGTEADPIPLQARSHYIFETPFGKFKIYLEDDSGYYGVDTEFEPKDASAYSDDAPTLPRGLFEINRNKKAIRILAWADPRDEDYTSKIEFEHPDALHERNAKYRRDRAEYEKNNKGGDGDG